MPLIYTDPEHDTRRAPREGRVGRATPGLVSEPTTTPDVTTETAPPPMTEEEKMEMFYGQPGVDYLEQQDGAVSEDPQVDVINNPEVAVRQELLNYGYDPSRVDELARQLIAQSGGTPSLTMGNVPNARAGQAMGAAAASPGAITADQAEGVSLSDLNEFGTGIGIGNIDPTQREVQDDELVSQHLEGLIAGDSRYIRNARMRGMEFANARGQLGSSFAAGAAERAALESALPIATADAQAYRDAATQNMNALNQFALANLQRATALDTALLDANTTVKLANLDAKTKTNMANLDAQTRISLGNLDAATRINIANLDAQTQVEVANMTKQTQLALGQLQADVQMAMQTRSLQHQVGMEQLAQAGRMDLALVDAELRAALTEAGFEHDLNMNTLDHEQQLIANDIINGYEQSRFDQDLEFRERAEHANMAMQAQINYVNFKQSYINTEMDAAAAARVEQQARDWLDSQLSMINGLYPNQPPISANYG